MSGGVAGWIRGLDLGNVGFVIVGPFLITWLAGLVVWRLGRIDDRWNGSAASTGR